MKHTKLTVLVDMDGVLADVYRHFLDWHQKETGEELDINMMAGILEENAFPLFKKHVNTEGFFFTAPSIPASIEGLEYLNNKYDVVIVSSATEFPNSLKDKYAWLQKHCPFISWHQMVFCGSKKYIKGDIMIDDHVKNLQNFEGKRILFSQPHNLFVTDQTITRVNTWKEIENML